MLMRYFVLKKDLPGLPKGTLLKCRACGLIPPYQQLIRDNDNSGTGLCISSDGKIYLENRSFGVQYQGDDIDNWLEELPTANEYERWRADAGGHYYYISANGKVCQDKESAVPWADDARFTLGNYFKTEEDAGRVLKYLSALAVVQEDANGFVPDWEDGEQKKWYIESNYYYANRLDVDFTERVQRTGAFSLPYFKTRNDAEASIIKHRSEWETIFNVSYEDKKE